jgi:tetratricopeptide (TPR) repeat protein
MKRIAYWALPLLLIGALRTQGFAQDPKWKDTAEYNDYMGVFNEKDFPKKATNAEKFFVDHKDADPIALTQVYQMMILSYANASNWVKTLETYDRMNIAPKLTDADKKQYLQIAFVASVNSKNNPKTIEFAEKILKDDPKNFGALVTLSGVLSQNLQGMSPTDANRPAQMTRTLDITRQSLALPRPDKMPDTQWNPIQQQLHETTCLILLNQTKYTDSIAECQAALKINPKDSYAWYLIGLSHKAALIDRTKAYNAAIDKFNNNRTAPQIELDEMREAIQGTEKIASDKRDETLDAFARAVAAGGEAAGEAKKELEKLFTGTPEELKKLIDDKKGGN